MEAGAGVNQRLSIAVAHFQHGERAVVDKRAVAR